MLAARAFVIASLVWLCLALGVSIAAALQESGDDALRAAELLGMAPRLLVKKVRTLGLRARTGIP